MRALPRQNTYLQKIYKDNKVRKDILFASFIWSPARINSTTMKASLIMALAIFAVMQQIRSNPIRFLTDDSVMFT